MTLADDLAAMPERTVGDKPCKFGKILATFPDEVDTILEWAQPGHDFIKRRGHLMGVLKKHGYPIANTTIDRHLAECCGCYR